MASEKNVNLKKEEVSKLAAEMKESKLILFTDYRGINVADDTTLRRDLRNVKTTCNIIKNNITRRALKEAGIDGFEELAGPTAVIMSKEDYLEPSKVVYAFAKVNEYYQIKGGVIDGKVMTGEEIITLAKLPSRETLLSMLAGALLSNISKVAIALDQVRIQKEEAGEKVTVSVPVEAVAEATAEAPVEATAEVSAEAPAEETAEVAEKPAAEEVKAEDAE